MEMVQTYWSVWKNIITACIQTNDSRSVLKARNQRSQRGHLQTMTSNWGALQGLQPEVTQGEVC